MVAAYASETSEIFYQAARRHIRNIIMSFEDILKLERSAFFIYQAVEGNNFRLLWSYILFA
jgi:hypothetical protein